MAKLLLNSLYGRFGMDDSFVDIIILDNVSYIKFEKDHAEDIIDILNLDNKVLIKCRPKSKDINTLLDSVSEKHNINIAVASAITAYGRIHMSYFKNNPNINLYYTDTDSIYTDSEIDESLISDTVLGKLKLENICNKAIFLSPKVYYLETEEGKTIYKVKGLKHETEISINDFKQLLNKDSLIKKKKIKLSDLKILVKVK
jgi:DNA polymerase type B, organellar and viral